MHLNNGHQDKDVHNMMRIEEKVESPGKPSLLTDKKKIYIKLELFSFFLISLLKTFLTGMRIAPMNPPKIDMASYPRKEKAKQKYWNDVISTGFESTKNPYKSQSIIK